MLNARALAAILLLLGAPAAARPAAAVPAAVQSDQERARGERLEGRILDYAEIVRRATAAVPGRVVGQRLDRAGGDRYVYRLRILQADGAVASVVLDAQTGRILRIRGRR